MKELGTGIAWAGFWVMIGLANFGETKMEISFSKDTELVKLVKMYTENETHDTAK